jgi:GTP-binding protein LepA
MNTVMTTPSVPYKIRYYSSPSEYHDKIINNISEWPDQSKVTRSSSFDIYEPIAKVTIISPNDYYGVLLDIVKQRRGNDIEVSYLDDGKTFSLHALVPWQEIVVDMHDVIKNSSSGYASFDYEEAGYAKASLVKVDIVVNGEVCDPLSFISHQDHAQDSGRKMSTKLKEVIERQQFEIVIQARVSNKVLARERIPPYRKDVLARSGKTVGGGDVTRKKKLLEKQKEGKKRAKMIGKVEIAQEAFWAVLQR